MKIESLDPQDFSDFLRRAFGRLFDSLISMAIIPVILQLLFSSLNQKDLSDYLLLTLPTYVLWVFMMMRWGGTPGKLIAGMRVVDGNGKFLSFMQVCKRMTPEILVLINSVFQRQTIMRNFHDFNKIHNIEELVNVINQYSGPYLYIANILTLLFIADCLIVLFHPRKQSAHDILAESFVVNKFALEKLRSEA